MNVLELSEQEIIRRNSLNELRAMGIDPYPARIVFTMMERFKKVSFTPSFTIKST